MNTDIKSLNLEACQDLLAKILSGELKVKDGALVPSEKPGPRGPTAKVQPRLEACQAMFLELAGRPEGITATWRTCRGCPT